MSNDFGEDRQGRASGGRTVDSGRKAGGGRAVGRRAGVYRADDRDGDASRNRAAIGLGAALAAGAALYVGGRLFASRNNDKPFESDAPRYTARGRTDLPVGRTVTVGKPRQELYDFWRDFTNQTQFAENIESVEMLDDTRVRFVMKAPAGTTVTLVNRVVEDVPGSAIAWESEPESEIRNSGRVEFTDAPPGRGTIVRVTISYDPPGGVVGKLVGKLLQREPNVQARRDLRRFKQLMETGEVTNSASPSGRKSESPTEQHL